MLTKNVLALAYLGRNAQAMKEGERAVALWPTSRDGYIGPYLQHQLARIYTVVGQPDKAVPTSSRRCFKTPYFLSPAWLRIDPNFEPLRKTRASRRCSEEAVSGER